jgi:hypothetical protein
MPVAGGPFRLVSTCAALTEHGRGPDSSIFDNSDRRRQNARQTGNFMQ